MVRNAVVVAAVLLSGLLAGRRGLRFGTRTAWR